MNELEKAIRRGVPTYETSLQLDWQHPTTSYWTTSKDGSRIIVDESAKILIENLRAVDAVLNHTHIAPNETNVKAISIKGEFIPAPMMHEIASVLPNCIEMQQKFVLGQGDGVRTRLLFFKNNQSPSVDVKNHHYAQAYAELYIQLRNENLLE